MKYKGWIRGTSVLLSFIGSLLIALELIATSSADYKNLVDGVFGINYKAATSDDISTYVYQSDFKNTTELITKRSQVAAQLEEEGVVMLKNNDNLLPLRKSENQEVKITLLGSRAFTFKNNADRSGLRDVYDSTSKDPKEMNAYAGIVGSRTWGQTVTLESGSKKLPVTLIDGLTAENIQVNPSCEQVYASKPFPNPPSGSEADGSRAAPFSIGEPDVSKSEFSQLDVYKDAAIVVIGRFSGEGREYIPGERGIADKGDGSKSALNLSNAERNLINIAKEISNNNVIVLLNSAIPMEIEELKNDNDVKSVLWIGLPGLYGMDGVAKVISGTSNPSGSLPDIYAVDASASPAAQNYGLNAQTGESFSWSNPLDPRDNPTAEPKDQPYSATHSNDGYYVVLAEGIYDGYFYYETRYADTIYDQGNASSAKGAGREKDGDNWKYENEVTYSFGYGMSYTTFDLEIVNNESSEPFTFNKDNLTIDVNVKVTNTGEVAGKKSVQLYLSSPFTEYDKANHIEKSAIQLMGFAKTEVLGPSESEIVTINFPIKYIASYSETVGHDGLTGGYILEDAPYYFALGNGAHEALNNIIVNKDATLSSVIYSEIGATVDSDLVFSYNPASDSNLTSIDRGGFTDGINATILNKNEEGNYISNQIQNANYNYYKPNTITYLSRTDWDATFPVAYPGLEIIGTEMIHNLGKGLTTRGHVYELTSGKVDVNWGVDHTLEDDDNGEPLEQYNLAHLKGASYDDERWVYLIDEINFDEAHNFVPDGGNRCASFKSINAPEVWQIDGPNGNVNKGLGDRATSTGPTPIKNNDPNYNYKTCDMPCEPIIAATFNKDLVLEEGKSFGDVSLWDGSKICWAPGMNLHRTPFNSRNHEYYSEDPMLTNIMGSHFVKGGLSKGALLSAKHFAFNTQESYREGLGQFLNEQSGRELELRGFQGLFEDINYETPTGTVVNALGLMSSFSRLGVTGVNGHTGLMVNILRKEMGFKGLISTDFVGQGNYFNPQDCAVNGVTFMACGSSSSILQGDWSSYKNLAKNDPNINRGLKECMHYYLYAVANSNALNGFDKDTQAIDSSAQISPWQIGLITGGIVSLLISAGGVVFYILICRKKTVPEIKEGE